MTGSWSAKYAAVESRYKRFTKSLKKNNKTKCLKHITIITLMRLSYYQRNIIYV